MTKEPEELLGLRIGATNVGENLRRSIASGRLIENEDGTLEIASNAKQEVNWMFVSNGPPLGCGFLMGFMFHHAYASESRGAVTGCSALLQSQNRTPNAA